MEFTQEENVSSSTARGSRSSVDNGTENPEESRWREIIIGNYNWGFLCTPRIVCGGKRDLPPFYGKDGDLPLLLAAVMGLQHALAMVGGIMTPPILIASSAGFSADIQAYLVSAALIVSAFASFIQILQIKIPFTPYVIGPSFEKSIQGAILADGLNTFLAALGTMTPVTTYAQNNGVISLSRCASRRAGFACCIWLLVLGVFSKFAAILVSIPNCVLGGMTTFLFSSVVVSGIHVLNLKEGLTRRNRFIAIIALGIGLGVNLVPSWVNISGQSNYPFEGNLWPVNPGWSASYRGFRDAIILILSNGYSVGGLLALILNLILPFDNAEKELPIKQPLIQNEPDSHD